MTTSEVSVLDCTIRDGSYAVDYQFTAEDTAIVAAGLSAVGIRHIEVGHGLGLGGDRQMICSSATTDIEAIKAARQAIRGQSVVGCFYIPSVGNHDEMRAAADAGLQFIRLGSDIDRYSELQSSIELARSLNLEVWGNLMKSYIATPEFFATAVRDLADMGAHVVALVDSAGGMTPDQVADYTYAAKDLTNTPLAFHGHDNLRLAVANCLRFVECGGQYVDGSLGGIGRSSGNAATELLAALLARKNRLHPKIDWESLLEFADEFLRFSVPHRASTDSSEAAMGLGYIHSGFEAIISNAASENGTTVARTVLRLPDGASKTVSNELAQEAAISAVELATVKQSTVSATALTRRSVMDRSESHSLSELKNLLAVEKGKWSREVVVTLVLNADCQNICLRPLRSSAEVLVAHIEVADIEHLQQIYLELSERVDVWLFDSSIDRMYWIEASDARYEYRDDLLVQQACMDTLQTINARSVHWLGYVNEERQSARLPQIASGHSGEPMDAMVVTEVLGHSDRIDLKSIRSGGHLVVAAPQLVPEDVIETARLLGINVIRVDYGPALLAEAERLIRTRERTESSSGEVVLSEDVTVVAGGLVGPTGAIIVDSIVRPRFILGKADGTGGVTPLDEAANEELPLVKQWIYGHWVQSLSG